MREVAKTRERDPDEVERSRSYRPWRRRLPGLFLFAGLALSVAGDAQEPAVRSQRDPGGQAPLGQSPSFGQQVELVRVDVVVTDKSGQPVRGLAKEDFTLLDEGRPQMVETFEAVDLPLPPERAAEAPRPRVASNEAKAPSEDLGRSFVVFFDNLNLTMHSVAPAKAAVAMFLDKGLRDGDRVTFISTGGEAWWSTRVPEGRSDLLAILKSLEGRRVKTDSRDAITDFEAMRIYLYQDTQVGLRVQRRFETYGVTSRVESAREREQKDIYIRGVNDPYVERRAAEEYLKVRTRNRVVFAALERAMKPLAATKERKVLLLVCDGFVFDTQEDAFARVTELARRANVVLYFLDTRGLRALGLYSAQFPTMPGQAGDLGAVLSDTSQDAEGAEFLALETGGFAVHNTNDLTPGVERIAQEARAYYLLGYGPSVPRDGRFRKLEVKVRGRGITVRARRGYYAPADAPPAPEKTADGKDTAFQEALDAATFRSDLPLRLTAYVLGEGAGGQARVLVAAEADVRGVTFEEKEGQLLGALDLLLIVARRETGEFSRYDQRIDLARKPGPPPPGSGFHPVVREFDLRPGGYQAKMVVRDPASGKLGSVAYDFEVPPLGGFRVSTPVLTDLLQQNESGGVGPVVVARRTFAAGRPLYCRFDVYGPGRAQDGQPRVSAGHLLRGADGTVIGRSDPTPVLPSSLGAVARLMQIPLNVEPGDYELILTVRDETTGELRELVEPFRVVPRGS